MSDKENILEMICAAINDCEDAKLLHTVTTLEAVLHDLEKLFDSTVECDIFADYGDGWELLFRESSFEDAKNMVENLRAESMFHRYKYTIRKREGK